MTELPEEPKEVEPFRGMCMDCGCEYPRHQGGCFGEPVKHIKADGDCEDCRVCDLEGWKQIKGC